MLPLFLTPPDRADHHAIPMNVPTSIRQIQLALFAADDKYGEVVFDEWILVSLVGLDRTVLHYAGPRYEHDGRAFVEDLRPLADELVEHRHRIGKVDFAPDAFGPGFDAMITVGAGFYAILNDTRGSTIELQESARWKEVEADLISLGEKFRDDPLAATESDTSGQTGGLKL